MTQCGFKHKQMFFRWRVATAARLRRKDGAAGQQTADRMGGRSRRAAGAFKEQRFVAAPALDGMQPTTGAPFLLPERLGSSAHCLPSGAQNQLAPCQKGKSSSTSFAALLDALSAMIC